MVNEENYLAVQSSYGRCCSKADFWDKFYDFFLKSSPSVAEKFKNTDMKRQKRDPARES